MDLTMDGTGLRPQGDFGEDFGSPFAFSTWPPDTYRPVFPRYPQCPAPFGCVGHADMSTLDTHDTHFERFGPSGVVVTLIRERPPLVSTENARTLWTPEHALLYAAEITSAAQFAQRYALLAAFPGTAPAPAVQG